MLSLIVFAIIATCVFGFYYLLYTAIRPLTEEEKARGEALVRNLQDRFGNPGA